MSIVFLEEVERFATYVGDAIVNEHIDTGNLTEILLAEENIGIPSIYNYYSNSGLEEAVWLLRFWLDQLSKN